MLNAKVRAIFLGLIIFGGILSLTSSLPSNVAVISNTGEVSTNKVMARSGTAADIQVAVNTVASRGGGAVYIPAGTFNFVNVGQQWVTVNVPAGVSIFGAPNERFANGSNKGWNTVLVMPYDVPGNDSVGTPAWFRMSGNGDPNKPSRFSDVKLIGYRFFNNASTSMHNAIEIYGVIDFRIDHSYFLDTTAGIDVFSATRNGAVRGVIDHNIFINTFGYPGYGINPYPGRPDGFAYRTIGYGVMPYRTSTSDYWDSNIYNVLGHYTDYTVFIEDNYFSKWRHDVAANNGMHYVFRHNVVVGDFGQGSVDAHGTYTYVGTRAMEIYYNQFLDPEQGSGFGLNVANWRGGGGVFFNNTIRGYYFIINKVDEGPVPQCWPGYSPETPIYMWDTTYLPPLPSYIVGGTGDGTVNNIVMPNYTPYQYPHPLTFVTSP